MKPKRKTPDTEIRCPVCKGTGKNSVVTRPSGVIYYFECGVCFGTGLSGNPSDQRRNGTMVGVESIDLAEAHEIIKNKPMSDTRMETEGRVVGKKRIGIFITWANTEYEARLALDQKDQLYPE